MCVSAPEKSRTIVLIMAFTRTGLMESVRRPAATVDKVVCNYYQL